MSYDLSQAHACEAKIGYVFKEPWLLWEALLADGAPAVLLSLGALRGGHKRLAIIGDKVLDLLLPVKWYPTLKDTAVYSDLREKVTSNENFIAIFDQAKLEGFVSIAPGAIQVPPKAKTATVEAIVGAVYLDASADDASAGITAAKEVAKKLGIEVFEDESQIEALREA